MLRFKLSDFYVVNNFVLSQTDRHFLKNCFFFTQGVSKPKNLMKISKVIFHIKLIPSH